MIVNLTTTAGFVMTVTAIFAHQTRLTPAREEHRTQAAMKSVSKRTDTPVVTLLEWSVQFARLHGNRNYRSSGNEPENLCQTTTT